MTAPFTDAAYIVLVVFEAAPGRAQEFSKTMSDSVAGVRGFKGNHCYDFNHDPADPNRFMLYEIFDSEASWEEHHARPELQKLLETIKPMLNGKPQRSVWAGAASR